MQRLSEARENTTKWVLVEGCAKGCSKKILDSASTQTSSNPSKIKIGGMNEIISRKLIQEIDQDLRPIAG